VLVRQRILLGAALGLCLAAALPVHQWAQWTGEIGGGYVWQRVAGNEDSFVTQYGQRQGFVLEDFNLAYVAKPGERESFAANAWGFGGAEPAQHASVLFRPGCGWTFDLAYDRQAYFYGIAAGDLANRRSQWALERWRGSVVWDGWSEARLTLDLRYYKKDGSLYRGVFYQRNVFPTLDNLDQNMKEASIKIETKTLPVYLSFEQAFSQYERRDRWEPDGSKAIYGTSQSSLAELSTPRNDKTNVPSSRFIASYRNDIVDVAGSLFYSKSDLDSSGTRFALFDVGGGSIGQFRYLDDLAGSAQQDTRAGDVDVAFHLGAGWSIRVKGDYRDSAADSSQLGANILRIGKPGGQWDVFYTPVDQAGYFDVKDATGRFELDKQGPGWALWAGYQGGSRDVSWKRERDDPGEAVKRTGDGWFVGGSWSRSPALRINTEYEHGTFEHYVFRTSPDLVERFTFKLTSSLGSGWSLGARARYEWAENPESVAAAKRRSQAFGANVGWANAKGTAGVGLTADMLTLDTHTDIYVPPTGALGLSAYNLDVLALTANAYFTAGPVHFSADITRLRDSGYSWPLETWGADLRAAIDGPKRTQFVLFGQYHSYVADLSRLDNYYARRYGVIVRWRF
jgi:hypothetical protein